mmetsp:Transcript_74/g.80  ORF Transcript_74/g.80 Transcript_74/m.80 type:complete len:112 (+) Transcript_74:196-531(+)
MLIIYSVRVSKTSDKVMGGVSSLLSAFLMFLFQGCAQYMTIERESVVCCMLLSIVCCRVFRNCDCDHIMSEQLLFWSFNWLCCIDVSEFSFLLFNERTISRRKQWESVRSY